MFFLLSWNKLKKYSKHISIIHLLFAIESNSQVNSINLEINTNIYLHTTLWHTQSHLVVFSSTCVADEMSNSCWIFTNFVSNSRCLQHESFTIHFLNDNLILTLAKISTCVQQIICHLLVDMKLKNDFKAKRNYGLNATLFFSLQITRCLQAHAKVHLQNCILTGEGEK